MQIRILWIFTDIERWSTHALLAIIIALSQSIYLALHFILFIQGFPIVWIRPTFLSTLFLTIHKMFFCEVFHTLWKKNMYSSVYEVVNCKKKKYIHVQIMMVNFELWSRKGRSSLLTTPEQSTYVVSVAFEIFPLLHN